MRVLEVAKPAPQHRVQIGDDRAPGCHPACARVLSRILSLKRLQALLPHPAPTRLEAIAEKVEAFPRLPAIADLGLVRVQRQAVFLSPKPAPSRSAAVASSAAAAQDHEVVGVAHHPIALCSISTSSGCR